MVTSPFLAVPESAWVASNELAFAIRDGFPVSPGHTLIVSRRLVGTWFDATAEEQAAVWALVNEVKRRLDAEFHPDGYNVGLNAGPAAGQTVMHLHVHVIPRYTGDMVDPRGGVRGVIPGKQNYAPPGPTGKPFAALPSFVHGDDLHFEHTFRDALLVADRADILSAFLKSPALRRARRASATSRAGPSRSCAPWTCSTRDSTSPT